RHDFPDVVGRGPAMREVLGLLDRLAAADVAVLLEGETGTGKEVFARSLHAASARAAAPFVALNCAAVPAGLFDAELFGYRRGGLTIAPPAEKALARYPWPGNVRELENELIRASVLADGRTIARKHLSPHVRSSDTGRPATGDRGDRSLHASLAEAERTLLRE